MEELINIMPKENIVDEKDVAMRHIYVDCDIQDDLIDCSKRVIRYNVEDAELGIDPDDRRPIYIYIYSHGGDLSAVNSMISVCEASLTPVVTVNMGIAMSAGMLLLLSGHKRYCLKRSKALIHNGSGGIEGTYENVVDAYENYVETIKEAKEYIFERTKITPQELKKHDGRDWYLSDKDQLKYGVVDAIVSNIGEITDFVLNGGECNAEEKDS